MTEYLVFALLGLGSGAVFAALALGLVMTYRSSGVVNFGTGAIALYAAYTYSFLRQGRVLILLPGLPQSVGLGGELGFLPAFALAVLMSALLGAVLYLLVFRQLRSAPPVAKAVASVGLMVMLQALFATRLGTEAISVGAILPRRTLSIGGVRVPADRLWFALVIVLIAVTLSLLMRFTRFGLVTRAAAETEKGAVLTGLSPDRIAVANWALSSAVAGVGGILIAPIVPLVPGSYTLFIVAAMAAALVANFQGLAVVVAVGLVIGMLQSELTFLQARHTWLPQHGLAEMVPLVLILAVLVVRGRPLPQRGALTLRSPGHAPAPRRVATPAAVGLLLGTLALLLTSGVNRSAIISSVILAVIALSLVVVTGYAGQVSLAQLTLAGAGAFLLSRFGYNLGIPFPIAPLLAALGASVIGVVIGLPALRIRGLPVAVVTLALAVGVQALWFANPDFTGGVQGARIRPPSLFGLDLGVGAGSGYPRIAFGLMCLVVLVVVAAGVALLRTSRLGACMLAVRTNERAAAAAGINVARTKLTAFGIAAFIAGLGGSLLAYQQTLASPDVYQALAGFGFFATVYVAGVTSVSGGLLAGVIAAGGISQLLLTRLTSGIGAWWDVITGLLLVTQVIYSPAGIAGGIHRGAERINRRWPARQRPVRQLAQWLPKWSPKWLSKWRRTRTAPAVRADTAPALEVTGVGVRYGGVVAVKNVSLGVPRGFIVGVIGPNGAGKTTLIDALNGFAPCTGSVRFDGRLLDGRKPHQRARLGLARTFQGLELWEDLSVEDNIRVGQVAHGGSRTIRDGQREALERLLTTLTLEPVRHTAARELSQGQRQLVSIARSLASQPELVLLDEPAGGLDSMESQWLAGRLRTIRESGITIIVIDHDMGFMLNVCDEIHVLDLGELIASGTPDQIRRNPRVAEAYLGPAESEHGSEHGAASGAASGAAQ